MQVPEDGIVEKSVHRISAVVDDRPLHADVPEEPAGRVGIVQVVDVDRFDVEHLLGTRRDRIFGLQILLQSPAVHFRVVLRDEKQFVAAHFAAHQSSGITAV